MSWHCSLRLTSQKPTSPQLHLSSSSIANMAFELYVWGPGFSLPSADPQCLAAIAYLSRAVPRQEWTVLTSSVLALDPSCKSAIGPLFLSSNSSSMVSIPASYACLDPPLRRCIARSLQSVPSGERRRGWRRAKQMSFLSFAMAPSGSLGLTALSTTSGNTPAAGGTLMAR